MSYLPFSQGGILSITGNYRYRISQYGFLFDKKKQTKNTCSDGSYFFQFTLCVLYYISSHTRCMKMNHHTFNIPDSEST